MFGIRKSHPNYRKPIKLKYRPSPAVIIAAIAVVAVAALVVYILFFNKGNSDTDENILQENKDLSTEEVIEEPIVQEKKDYTEQAKKAADGFMSEFCRLDFEGMSEYCNKDIAKMMGYSDFESYVDGQFDEIADSKMKAVYSEISDIVVECSKNNMDYTIAEKCTEYDEKYKFDVTLTAPEYWDAVLEQLSVSGRQKIADEVAEENREELSGIKDKEQLSEVLEEKIYEKAVDNIRDICKNPETKQIDGKVTVIKKEDKWVVDVDNSDLRVFVDSLINSQ